MEVMKTILIGSTFISLGCVILWVAYKHPVRKQFDFTEANVKGYIAGIGFIIVGILTFVGWFKW